MAINTISKGKDLNNPTYGKQCPRCECMFTYQNEDTIEKPTGRYYKDFEEYFIKDDCDRKEIAVYVECPWCNNIIHVMDRYVKT